MKIDIQPISVPETDNITFYDLYINDRYIKRSRNKQELVDLTFQIKGFNTRTNLTHELHTPFSKVRAFHQSFEADVDKSVTKERLALRKRLIKEEIDELFEEFDKQEENLEKINPNLLKELADALYVLIGTAVAFGLPVGPAFDRVHRSNMSKLDLDGRVIRDEQGKVLKGSMYKPANLEDLV